LQVSSLLQSCITGGVAMITVIAFCSGLFSDNLADFLFKPKATMRSYLSTSALTSLLTVFDILINLLETSLFFSVFNVWTVIS
jgi:hypothetical protein